MIPFDTLTVPLSCKCLIEASAGTGKTYAIASLYLRLVIEQGLAPENILVVTFTDAATKELRDRIRLRLRQARGFFAGEEDGDELLDGIGGRIAPDRALARIDAALQQFDAAAIATIHSFCASVLNENRFETGSLFDTEIIAERGVLLSAIMDDYWRCAFFGADARLLQPVLKRRLTPERLVKLLDRKIQSPFTRILPDDVSSQELDSRIGVVFAELAALWQQERVRLMELIRTSETLTRNDKSYREDHLPALFDAMDAYIAAADPYDIFPELDKLTSEKIARETKKKFAPLQEPLFEMCSLLASLVNRRVTAFIIEAASFARKEMPSRKGRLNLRSYDDLLTDLLAALEGDHGDRLVTLLQERFQAALIDEFQDTDQIQFQIFNRIYGRSKLPLFLIGDPKQAIYSFRGADLFAYLDAKAGVEPGCRYSMATNWRSTGAMVQAVNHLFGRKAAPFIFPGVEFQPVAAVDLAGAISLCGFDQAPLQLWFFNREDGAKVINKGAGVAMIAAKVADEIAALLAAARSGAAAINGRPLAPADIAVIVRSHKQADIVKEELTRRAIPAVLQSGRSIFSCDEAAELALVMAAIAAPARESALKGALITSIFGCRAEDVYRLCHDENLWDERVAAFTSYREIWQSRGFMVMFRTLMHKEAVVERLLGLPNGERRLTNLQQAAEILHGHESAGKSGLQRLVTWFCEQLAGQPEDDAYQLRLETDDSAVKVVTVHLSKGLEYPVVFAPFVWAGVMADSELALCHPADQLVADFGSDAFEVNSLLAQREALSESLRLLYVAVTRAKYRCYLAWGRFRDGELSAPAWLLHSGDGEVAELLQSLRDSMAKISDNEMVGDLERFASLGNGSVTVTVDPEPERSIAALTGETLSILPCRTFAAVIDRSWRVASFSSLVSGHKASPELPDRDIQDAPLAGQSPQTKGESIFTFPKGTTAGTLLHDIFEELDFSRVDDDYYRELAWPHLEKAALEKKWLAPVVTMLRSVMTTELGAEQLRLCDLPAADRRAEMEFFFPLQLVAAAGAVRLFIESDFQSRSLKSLAGMLNFREQQGVLLGFIDLVFSHGGRYYIIDWKSNHLGDSAQDYSLERMQIEMNRHLYPLQYLLYSVALHRYLQARLPAYRYETHFGGVFYLFIRGIDPAVPNSGVYFDRPAEELVTRLEQYFSGTVPGGLHG